jgi:hypothetical protein
VNEEVKPPPPYMRWPHMKANQVHGLSLREIGGGFPRHHRAPSIRAACYAIAKPSTMVQKMQNIKRVRGHRNAVYCGRLFCIYITFCIILVDLVYLFIFNGYSGQLLGWGPLLLTLIKHFISFIPSLFLLYPILFVQKPQKLKSPLSLQQQIYSFPLHNRECGSYFTHVH